MTTVDRYVLTLFLRVLAVSFLSLTGLILVIDTVGNLEEFIDYGATEGGILAVLFSYYGARVFTYFEMTSSLLTLVAAIFAITWLQRTNELTALMAAGIPKSRVAKPLVAAAVLVSLLAAANRECAIPLVRDKLTRNAQDWLGEKARPVQPCYDNARNFLITGRHTYAGEGRISEATFRWMQPLPEVGHLVIAENAYYRPAAEGRPSGYLLQGVTEPPQLGELPSVTREGQPVLYTPADSPWLKPDEVFLVSDVDFQQLASGDAWRRFSSTRQLIAGLHNGTLDYSSDVRVTIHARLVQPFLDLTLLFLGLPLVLTRENRNVFVAAGLCLLLVAVFFVVILVCQAMGRHSYLLSPSLAAWGPLLLFVPTAVAATSRAWNR